MIKEKINKKFLTQQILFSKYVNSKEELNKQYIDSLIKNKKCHYCTMFKDYLIYDFIDEFIIYTTNLREDSDYSNNTKQNENLTNFLNQCKIFLTPRNFELIVNIFQKYKDGYINEENVVIQTKKLLQNNLNLIKLFDSLFIVE